MRLGACSSAPFCTFILHTWSVNLSLNRSLCTIVSAFSMFGEQNDVISMTSYRA